MRVVQVGEAFPSLAYRCPGPVGITRERHLDRHEVTVDVLPGNLQAIVATGDLQGREDVPPHRLLGEAVADALRSEFAPSGLGVLLAGDLYANGELTNWVLVVRSERFGILSPATTAGLPVCWAIMIASSRRALGRLCWTARSW